VPGTISHHNVAELTQLLRRFTHSEPDVELAKADLAIRIQRLAEDRRLMAQSIKALP
jgi:hypothetical protein